MPTKLKDAPPAPPETPPDIAAEETPAATAETPSDSTPKAAQPSPAEAGTSPAETGTAAEEPPSPAAPSTALYHFPDANGLASVPVVAAADENGTYTLSRDGVVIATGVPASTEPLAGHVIL
jgi:hypothetical protein